MHPRIGRCVFSCVANTMLLAPLVGCSALQEPGPQLALATLSENAVRVAEAAAATVAKATGVRAPAGGFPRVMHVAAPDPDVTYFDPPTHPVRFAFVLTPRSRPVPVLKIRYKLSKQAVIEALRYRVATAHDDVSVLKILRELLALKPSDSMSWRRLAQLQMRLHAEASAATSLDRAVYYSPRDGEALLARAQLLTRLKRYSAAIVDLDAYLDIHGASRQALRMKIDVALAANDAAAALSAIDASIAIDPTDAVLLQERGNELDASGDERGAIASWKAYSERRPDDADAQKQIAYASERTGDIESAVYALSAYVRLRPSDDRLRLALAYDEARIGRPEPAVAAFEQLEHSADPDVAKQATAELRARMTAGTTASRLAYATVQYDSRFGDVVFGVDTYALAPARRIQPYAVLHSWDDTRSSARAYEPVVYNDNAEIFGAGFRYNLGAHPGSYFFAEVGEQISLIGRGTSPESRYGFASWSESGTPGRGHTAMGFSVASYSRYDADVIGYSNILHDFPLLPALRGVVGTNFALDTRRQYWNNFGELELGVKVGSPRFSFTLVGVDGSYLARGAGRPPRRMYTTLRPSITWSPHL